MTESNIQNFNHLKVHSQYSICEGAIKIDELKDFSKEYKRLLNDAPALCNITMLIDHWTCYIIALQNLFAQHKIRYIMCNTMQPIEQTSNNSDMIKMIDTSNYYKPFDVDESFYNWANLNYERTPCHHFPLKAHKDYAVKIMKEMKL